MSRKLSTKKTDTCCNNVEVLLSIMNKNSSVKDIVSRSNIKTDAVIINQSEKIEYINSSNIKYITLPEKGVGLSRNNALMRCTGDIILFADEDERLVDNYEKIILDAFIDNPKADMILFNVPSTNKESPTFWIAREHRVRRFNSLSYGATKIAVRSERVKLANVYFSLLFGGGSKYTNGEDSIFIYQCITKGLRVYTSTEVIGHVDQNQSSWFEGYNDRFFHDKGIFFWSLSSWLAYPYCIQFALRRRAFQSDKSTLQILNLMHAGIREIRKGT